MVAVPAAIIFVNNDLSDSTQTKLITQLHVNETIDGYTFDQRVAADANYSDTVKQLNLRLMVVRTFEDRGSISTWNEADVVIFVKLGLAAIEVNKFGPPGGTFKVVNLYWGQLNIFDR